MLAEKVEQDHEVRGMPDGEDLEPRLRHQCRGQHHPEEVRIANSLEPGGKDEAAPQHPTGPGRKVLGVVLEPDRRAADSPGGVVAGRRHAEEHPARGEPRPMADQVPGPEQEQLVEVGEEGVGVGNQL